METSLYSAGYDLYEISKDEWHMTDLDSRVYMGTFKEVVKHAVTMWGFKLSEVEIAISEMVNKGHNAAHFGVYKKFIFTFNLKRYKNGRQAS